MLHCCSQPCRVTPVEHVVVWEEHVGSIRQWNLNSLKKRGDTDRTVGEPLRDWKIYWKTTRVYHHPRNLCCGWTDSNRLPFCRRGAVNRVSKMAASLLHHHVCEASASLKTTSFRSGLCILHCDLGYRFFLTKLKWENCLQHSHLWNGATLNGVVSSLSTYRKDVWVGRRQIWVASCFREAICVSSRVASARHAAVGVGFFQEEILDTSDGALLHIQV